MFPSTFKLTSIEATLSAAVYCFCLVGLFPYVGYTIWSSLRASYLLRKVPGPSAPSWLWGCDWDMHKMSPGLRYLEWQSRYGNVVKFKGALNRNILAITDRRAVKYILEEHVFDFPKPHGVREWFRSLVGDGVLVVEGKAAHTRQRKLFAPALNPHAVKPLLPILYSLTSKMVDRLIDKANESTSPFIEEDLQWWTNRLSLDAIGLAGFSYDFHSISGDSNPLATSLEALTNTADNFTSFVMKALLFSFPSILKIPSQKSRYIAQTRAELGKVALDMWTCAKNSGESESVNRTLMSMMMEAEGAEIISNEEIAAQLRTLVQAGYETVGCQMAWILFEIARCPDTQESLRKEINSIVEPTYEDIVQKMPLLDAVLKESSRLHPPVLELTHVAALDTVVPVTDLHRGNSTITIPRGTIIHIPVNVLHTEPEVWGDDATIFRPQRWLDKSAEGAHSDRNLFAFSAGPRKCPGRYFAMLEMKVLVIVLLKAFVLQVVPDKPIEPFWSFVVRTRVQGQAHSTLPLRLSRL